MRHSRVRGSVAGLITLTVFGAVLLALKPEQEGTSGQPEPEKPKARPAGKPITVPANLVGLTISLGLKDQKPTDWEGDVSVSEGKIVSLETVRGNPKAKVEGSHFSLRSFFGKGEKKKKKDTLLTPIIRVNLDAPPSAKVTVTTGQGKFTVALADFDVTNPRTFLDEQVSVLREEGALVLTDPETEDDYPALAKAPDGSVWLAYSEYQKGKPLIKERVLAGNFETLVTTGHGDQIRLKKFDGKTWSPAIDVTDTGRDIWRPAIAVDKLGMVHVAWAEQVNGNWDIYHRSYVPQPKGKGEWLPIDRVTKHPGTDFNVALTLDRNGNVLAVWQGWRDGNFHILMAGPGLAAEKRVTTAKANHWNPALTTDSKGNIYVAYDTYEKGNYDVRLHIFAKDNEIEMEIANSARFEARPHIVCDGQDRLWIAYEEGDEQWGKDYSTNMFRKIGLEENPGFGLYNNRTIVVKCLAQGTLLRPTGDLETALKGKLDRNRSEPRLVTDSANGIWLLFRHHPLALGGGEVWNSYAIRYGGTDWSAPRQLPSSANLIDNRPALVSHGKGILAVYSGDKRNNTASRQQNDLFASMLTPASTAHGPPRLVRDPPTPRPQMADVHKNEKADVARIRNYRIDHGGKKLHLYRGEFHRHTEYTAHRDQDGSLEDSFRYSVDAAAMDWMGNGDHDNGIHDEYSWWQIQKVTDLYNHPPNFVGTHTYERSNKYPNGHRNVIMPKRGIRPLPRGDLSGSVDKGTPDTKLLYAYLKHFGGMCASHTSATGMGTDWRDNDPVAEPVVEIYQGHRHNYEHFGAPRSPTQETNIGGYEPKGFVWHAFEKGYKLGFQASSDHVSTHMSYAVVLTDDLSRKGIIDAFKRRHSYGATDNIILDVRSGKQLMGDIFTTDKQPTLEVRVIGTSPISKVSIVRSNKYVYSDKPMKQEVKLRYTDADAEAGKTHFYYVRVEQSDGNLAWASPMWITYQPKK
jgi:hypothetical protein